MSRPDGRRRFRMATVSPPRTVPIWMIQVEEVTALMMMRVVAARVMAARMMTARVMGPALVSAVPERPLSFMLNPCE